MAIAGILVLLALPRLLPRVSAPLARVALSIAASTLIGLEAMGVKVAGAVPSDLPMPAMPDLALAATLWPAALGIALMSLTESVAAARTFSASGDAPINANRELLAVGAANVASAFVGGLPAGGAASQTAVADEAGARSQMAQWVNAAAVLDVLLALSRLIGLLPQPALAALNPEVLEVLQRSPLGDALGRERTCINLHEALKAWQRDGGPPEPTRG